MRLPVSSGIPVLLGRPWGGDLHGNAFPPKEVDVDNIQKYSISVKYILRPNDSEIQDNKCVQGSAKSERNCYGPEIT